MDKYLQPAQIQFVDSVLPIPFQELATVNQAIQTEANRAAQAYNEQLAKFTDFQSPLSKDTQRYYDLTYGALQPLGEEFAKNANIWKDPMFRSKVNSELSKIPYGELANLRQSRDAALRYQMAREKAMLSGNYREEWDNVDFSTYQTSGEGGQGIFDRTFVPYQSMDEIVAPMLKNIPKRDLTAEQYKKLTDQDLPPGRFAQGIPLEDLYMHARNSLSNLRNNQVAVKHALEQLGLLRADKETIKANAKRIDDQLVENFVDQGKLLVHGTSVSDPYDIKLAAINRANELRTPPPKSEQDPVAVWLEDQHGALNVVNKQAIMNTVGEGVPIPGSTALPEEDPKYASLPTNMQSTSSETDKAIRESYNKFFEFAKETLLGIGDLTDNETSPLAMVMKSAGISTKRLNTTLEYLTGQKLGEFVDDKPVYTKGTPNLAKGIADLSEIYTGLSNILNIKMATATPIDPSVITAYRQIEQLTGAAQMLAHNQFRSNVRRETAEASRTGDVSRSPMWKYSVGTNVQEVGSILRKNYNEYQLAEDSGNIVEDVFKISAGPGDKFTFLTKGGGIWQDIANEMKAFGTDGLMEELKKYPKLSSKYSSGQTSQSPGGAYGYYTISKVNENRTVNLDNLKEFQKNLKDTLEHWNKNEGSSITEYIKANLPRNIDVLYAPGAYNILVDGRVHNAKGDAYIPKKVIDDLIDKYVKDRPGIKLSADELRLILFEGLLGPGKQIGELADKEMTLYNAKDNKETRIAYKPKQKYYTLYSMADIDYGINPSNMRYKLARDAAGAGQAATIDAVNRQIIEFYRQ